MSGVAPMSGVTLHPSTIAKSLGVWPETYKPLVRSSDAGLYASGQNRNEVEELEGWSVTP